MADERDGTPVTRKHRRKRTPTRLLSRERKEAKWKKLEEKKRQRIGPTPAFRDPAIIAQEVNDFGAQIARTATYLHEGADDPGGSLAWTNAAAWTVKEQLHQEKARMGKIKYRPPRLKKEQPD